MRKKWNRFAGVVLATALSLVAGVSLGQEEPRFKLDHFQLYEIEPHGAEIRVELAGQFDLGPTPAVLTRLTHFANPVSKNGEGILRREAHLTYYELKEDAKPIERSLTIRNQFGQQDITIGRATAFLAPALKQERESPFPWGLDHFKCYEVLSDQSVEKKVELGDQFGESVNFVVRARLLCVPVEKRIGERRYPIKNRRDHLTFYDLEPRPEEQQRWVRDQFGHRTVRTSVTRMLGVPTLKTVANRRCVDFENLAVGSTFGVSSTFTASGFPVEVKPFQWGNGASTSGGYAQIQSGGHAGGSGHEVIANNVNLAFDFLGSITDLTVRFGEYGGNLNLEINGDFRNFENFADVHGATIGGVGVAVVNGHGNDQGVLNFSGSIRAFAVGGQELWLDDLCPGSWEH